MNTEKLAHWLTILGNIGILAGLVMVVLQLNQNTASINGAAYQSWVAANTEMNMAFSEPLMSAAMEKGAFDSAGLDAESNGAFAMWNLSLMQMAQATDYLYRTGSLDEDLWRKEINRAAGHLGLPGVREWWDAGGRTQLTPKFVALVESTQSDIIRWTWEEGKGFVSDR